MRRSKIQLILNVLFAFVLLLVTASYVMGQFRKNTSYDAALAECRARGWQDGNLVFDESRTSINFLQSNAEMVLKTQRLGPGPFTQAPKTIHVRLHKPFNLMGWKVVAYSEE